MVSLFAGDHAEEGVAWCATSFNFDTDGLWGHCGPEPDTGSPTPTEPATPAPITPTYPGKITLVGQGGVKHMLSL